MVSSVSQNWTKAEPSNTEPVQRWTILRYRRNSGMRPTKKSNRQK